MRQRNLWTMTWALAFGALFCLVNAGFGDDSENSSSKKSKNSSSGDQAANRDQDSRQSGRSDDEDDAQYHAALGVSLSESDGHVKVIAVAPGSPASKAGLRVGDEIRYVGDERIRTAQGLTEEIEEYRPGSKVELSIRRNGERQTVKAKLASRRTVFKSTNQNEEQGVTASNRNSQSNRSSMASRGRTAYSYGANESQAERTQQQQLQHVQHLAWQLQQEINALQASMGQNRSYSGQQTQFLDRTNLRDSTGRGTSRDHGPRETTSGNTADED